MKSSLFTKSPTHIAGQIGLSLTWPTLRNMRSYDRCRSTGPECQSGIELMLTMAHFTTHFPEPCAGLSNLSFIVLSAATRTSQCSCARLLSLGVTFDSGIASVGLLDS
ncbi:hypothetical protein NPIL_132841 [Nephila pilipes]|uniref:Uncharacterized protein n=1 Tax=Nephila pilipes TaxID=299642 RepID=A0A8X6NXJ3_NEPPI|nr:hypothetical protein NPIL_132841 [Nephila pilipes]